MKINLGGLCVSFPMEDRSFERKLRVRYRHFMAGGGSASLNNSFAGPRPFEALAKEDGIGLKIRTVTLKMKKEPFRPAISEEKNFVSFKRGDFRCLFDAKRGKGILFISPSIQGFDSFLRTFYSRALLREGGMLLHSAGIVKNGKAYIFLGKSGAGKSTLSKLVASVPHPSSLFPPPFIPHPFPKADVISDELNLVRLEKGRFRVYGSPFWGEMRNEGRQGAWPLGGVFLLKKAGTNRKSPCSKPEALRLLLRCLVNFSRGPEDAALIIKNSARLLAGTGFSRLEFTKNNSGFLNFDW